MKELNSPRALRAQVLQDILRVVDADAALFFTVSDIDGRAVIADAQIEGDSDADRLADLLPGRRDFVDIACLQDPSALDSRSFQEGASLSQGFTAQLGNYGVTDRIRLFVYDGRRFVGWVGAVRFDSWARFSRADRRRLAPLVEPVTQKLLEADELARRSLPVEPGFVMMHAGGDVEYASREGQAWLQRPGFALSLQRRIAFVDVDGGTVPVELARCNFVPMIGAHRLFLVQLSESRAVEKSAVALSPTQREVVSFAVSGATVSEIASAIGRKPETVRSHLREAYTRLGVSNRVELVRALDTSAPVRPRPAA